MIEFGIGHEFWWKKQNQILLYVDLLLQKTSNKIDTFHSADCNDYQQTYWRYRK